MQEYYKQDCNFFWGGNDHPHRVHQSQAKQFWQPIQESINKYKKLIAQQQFPLLNLLDNDDDIDEFLPFAGEFREKYSEVIVLGTGGSSLGSHALNEMSVDKKVKLHILTNIDPFSFTKLLDSVNWQKTGVLAISKSGKTNETLVQFIICLERMKIHLTHKQISERLIMVAEPNVNHPFKAISDFYQCPILPHHPDISGRYSVLSIVGMLPIMIAGMNAKLIRQGARAALGVGLNLDYDANFIAQATAAIHAIETFKKTNSVVLLAYADRLGSLARWHRQLWAESIGKNTMGSTPIYCVGPVDQHSQLQLWLDGPKDKIFTVFHAPAIDDAHVVSHEIANLHPDLAIYKNLGLKKLMHACCMGTYETLVAHGLPVRIFDMQAINAPTIGALMMQFMLETMFKADLMGVDPFNQPAVEDGKKRIKSFLER